MKSLKNICETLRILAESREDCLCVYPVHMNPNERKVVFDTLDKCSNIHLLDPVPYDDMVFPMSKAHMIVTDSGGIQVEAPSFKVPSPAIHDNTERPEGVEAGCALLTGTDTLKMIDSFNQIYLDSKKYLAMKVAENLYGDCESSKRIVDILVHHVG